MIYGEKINLSKIGIERKLLNLIKEICKKPIAKNCFIMRSYIFPPNIRNNRRMPSHHSYMTLYQNP